MSTRAAVFSAAARTCAGHYATIPTASLLCLPATRDAPAIISTSAPDYALRLRRQLPPPRAALRACVIIPAKDEAASLPATLAALAAQVDLAGQPLPADSFEVIVLANNCFDGTATAVRHFARQQPALAVHVARLRLAAPDAHVGRARRLLMDEACLRLLSLGRFNGLIASTDADTRVAPDWLAATQVEIAAGADAVGGRILTDVPAGPLVAAGAPGWVRRTQLRDAAYHLWCARLEAQLDLQAADPWPRHHQHFGASLALTARAYRRVGPARGALPRRRGPVPAAAPPRPAPAPQPPGW